MIEKTIKLILRFNKLLIAGTLLLTAILFFWFVRVELGASLAGLMQPSDDPDYIFLERTHADFGSDYTLFISVTHDQIFSTPTLKKIENLITKISNYPFVERVSGLTNANITKGEDGEIYTKNLSGKIPKTEQEIAQFRKDVMQSPIHVGRLISEDEKSTIITVFFERSAPERKAREKRLRKSIRDIQNMALAAAGPEEIRISGFPATSAAIYKMLISDLRIFIPISLLIITLILYLNFKRWRYVLLALVFICIAVIWTFAFMALFKVPIFLLTSFIPLVAAALGISYSIHLFTEHLRQSTLDTDPKTIVKRTIRGILMAIWLSAITTAVGFVSLSAVGVVAIRELSVFMTIAVLSLLLLITFFIPSVLTFVPTNLGARRIRHKHLPERTSSRFINYVVRQRYGIIIFASVLTILSVLGIKKLYVNTDVLDIFKRSAPIRQATELMAERFRGALPIPIVIEAQKDGDIEDPSLLKSVEAFQSFLDQQSVVGKTTSIIDYLKTINKIFHDNDPDYYVLPETKEEISQYMLAYSLADPQRALDRYVDYNHRLAKIYMTTSMTGSAPALELNKKIGKECSKLLPPGVSCKATGEAMLVAFTAQRISHGILLSFGMAALAISTVLFLLFRSLKIGIIAMIPNLLPLLCILALMGWAGISFNIGTSVIVCVAIGIAVDDTIHFMTRYFHELKRSNHYFIRRFTNIRITSDQIRCLGITFNRLRRPIILTSVAIFLGFVSLGLSQFFPVIWFGTLTALTMVFCLLGDLILLPALLASIKI